MGDIIRHRASAGDRVADLTGHRRRTDLEISSISHDATATVALRSLQALQEKYDALGGAATLGEPVQRTLDEWTLPGGAALSYDATTDRAHHVYGAIYQHWQSLGGRAWGAPTTDESPCPDGVGRFNHFNDGTASIYWTPHTGPRAIYGDIRRRWAELGWEQGYLGYPVSDEVDFAEGGRATEFQHGGIYWWPDTGPIDLRDVVVHYTGLHAFGETDYDQGSDSDEPYVIVSVATPQRTATLRSRVYEDVDGGETRPDLIEVYRGRPYGITISTVVMEHDFGDPEHYRKEVQTTVDVAHGIGTAALGLIPIVGPFVAAVAGPSLGALMPKVGQAINDLLDTGDDRIGTGELIWTAKQMVLLAARTGNQEFRGIGFKGETPLVSGHGASYKAYFGIVPA